MNIYFPNYSSTSWLETESEKNLKICQNLKTELEILLLDEPESIRATLLLKGDQYFQPCFQDGFFLKQSILEHVLSQVYHYISLEKVMLLLNFFCEKQHSVSKNHPNPLHVLIKNDKLFQRLILEVMKIYPDLLLQRLRLET